MTVAQRCVGIGLIYWAVYWLLYWHVPIVTHCCATVTTHFQQCTCTCTHSLQDELNVAINQLDYALSFAGLHLVHTARVFTKVLWQSVHVCKGELAEAVSLSIFASDSQHPMCTKVFFSTLFKDISNFTVFTHPAHMDLLFRSKQTTD